VGEIVGNLFHIAVYLLDAALGLCQLNGKYLKKPRNKNILLHDQPLVCFLNLYYVCLNNGGFFMYFLVFYCTNLPSFYKMKPILFLSFVWLSAQPLFGQSTPPSILCGNDAFSTLVRSEYPELQSAFERTFQNAQQTPRSANRSPLRVRVVVHVVWKNAAENVADSIIENQIQVLNEDFNRLNPDTANLRAFFEPVAGNANILFELEEIVRVQTSEAFAIDILGGTNLLPELKSSMLGGSSAWDTEHYLNLWVCKIQPTTIFGIPVGQILGFAFPPNNLGNWPADSGAPMPNQDGVVLDFRMIGRNNPNTLPNPTGGGGNITVAGRTATHEVGHYLGLRHIWGDGGLLGPNNCNQSDGIADTPQANAQSEFDCNTNKNTCPTLEPFYGQDVPDMVENYMDYSQETCMNMFTKGQVELMRNVLTGPRSGLLESTSTVAPIASTLRWNISPNPSSGPLSLRFDLAKMEEVQIRVWNPAGTLLQTTAPHTYLPGTYVQRLDASHWPAGLYFVELQTSTGKETKKVIRR